MGTVFHADQIKALRDTVDRLKEENRQLTERADNLQRSLDNVVFNVSKEAWIKFAAAAMLSHEVAKEAGHFADAMLWEYNQRFIQRFIKESNK